MVRFQGLTAAAPGTMLSAQARGSTGDQHVASTPLILLESRQFGATGSGTSNGPSGG